MDKKRILILNGSCRKKGTSFSFSSTLKKLAVESGNTAQIVHVIDYFDKKESFEVLMDMIAQCDITALVAPLYSDALPCFDIWMLEKLADECKEELKGKIFFAIGQCGFPDITRIEPLLDSCRFFAEESGMIWLGGLAYGGGPMINGAPLESLGKKGEKITLGFKLALESLCRGEKIPQKSQELITFNIPKILYRPLTAFMNHNARKLARKNGNADFTKKVYLFE